MKGLSMDKLTSLLKGSVSKMTVCKYEKGVLKPGSSAVIALSEALERSPDYFFRPYSFSVESVRFRKKASLGAKKRAAIQETVSDFAERYFEIEEICLSDNKFENPLTGTVRTDNEVMEAVAALRNLWGIGMDGIVNIIELLECRGIKVLEIEADEKFDGLSAMVNGAVPIIVVNKNFSPERKRFTCIHETGHTMLPFDPNISEKEQERLCNLFANEMLIPTSLFKSVIGTVRHDISYQELRNLQIQFGISIDALMFKARYSGVITENRYKQYFILKHTRPDFKALMETSLYPEESSGRFKSLVYRALSSDVITVSKAAALLNVPPEKVRREFVLV